MPTGRGSLGGCSSTDAFFLLVLSRGPVSTAAMRESSPRRAHAPASKTRMQGTGKAYPFAHTKTCQYYHCEANGLPWANRTEPRRACMIACMGFQGGRDHNTTHHHVCYYSIPLLLLQLLHRMPGNLAMTSRGWAGQCMLSPDWSLLPTERGGKAKR